MLSLDPKFNQMLPICVSLAYLCVCLLSHVQLFVTLWTVAHQASLTMGFSWQEYWSHRGKPLAYTVL